MRLIDADELRRKWQDVLARNPEAKGTVGYRTFELFIERLDYEPTIEAEPVRHGRWLKGSVRQPCSVCRYKGVRSWKYCPLCGAKMDKEKK